MNPLVVIERVASDGKYAEFWFYNPNADPGRRWDNCCKWYMLHEVVDAYEEVNGDLDVLNLGWPGIVLTWPEGADRPSRVLGRLTRVPVASSGKEAPAEEPPRWCGVPGCGLPQHHTPSGWCCSDTNHGGAPSLFEPPEGGLL